MTKRVGIKLQSTYGVRQLIGVYTDPETKAFIKEVIDHNMVDGRMRDDFFKNYEEEYDEFYHNEIQFWNSRIGMFEDHANISYAEGIERTSISNILIMQEKADSPGEFTKKLYEDDSLEDRNIPFTFFDYCDLELYAMQQKNYPDYQIEDKYNEDDIIFKVAYRGKHAISVFYVDLDDDEEFDINRLLLIFQNDDYEVLLDVFYFNQSRKKELHDILFDDPTTISILNGSRNGPFFGQENIEEFKANLLEMVETGSFEAIKQWVHENDWYSNVDLPRPNNGLTNCMPLLDKLREAFSAEQDLDRLDIGEDSLVATTTILFRTIGHETLYEAELWSPILVL